MAVIQRIEAGWYRIDLPEVLTDATHGEMRGFEIITARVFDAEGAEGVGYTFTCGRNGGAVYDLVGREIPEIATGEDADRIERIWEKLWWGLHYGGRGGPSGLAISAVDIALWDLKAKRAGQPLWRYLGGRGPTVSCYAGGIDLEMPIDALLRQTDDNLAKGFRAIKMKVGREKLSEDAARVKAMREHLGADMPLMLDANMKWTPDQAIRAARAFAPYDPTWLEEPVPPEDVPGCARVLRDGGVAVATGENLRSLGDFRQLVAAEAVSFPEPDVTNCGGVTVFMKVAHLAEAFNLPVTSHGAHDITVHLLAAAPNGRLLEAHGFGLDDYISHPMEIREGLAIAPDRPGHGMAFDWAKLETLKAH